MLHLLDTNIASYLIKGRGQAIEARLARMPPDGIAVSVITRAELMYGLKRLPPAHRLHLVVKQFMKLVRVLPWEAEAADWYAEIRHQLTARGAPIGEMDMMIAAHALALGATLVTNNMKHFGRIKAPLMLENWLAEKA